MYNCDIQPLSQVYKCNTSTNDHIAYPLHYTYIRNKSNHYFVRLLTRADVQSPRRDIDVRLTYIIIYIIKCTLKPKMEIFVIPWKFIKENKLAKVKQEI